MRRTLVVVGDMNELTAVAPTPSGTGVSTLIHNDVDLVLFASPGAVIVDDVFDAVIFSASGKLACQATTRAYEWAQNVTHMTREHRVVNSPIDPRTRGQSRYRDGRNT